MVDISLIKSVDVTERKNDKNKEEIKVKTFLVPFETNTDRIVLAFDLIPD